MSDNENESAQSQAQPPAQSQAQSQDETQKKERIELVKHVTVLCFGASAGAYLILGITVEAKEIHDLDFRAYILLGALAVFLSSLFAGAMAFSEHISKDLEFYNIKERFMIELFLFGLGLLWLYIITISWLVAAIAFGGVTLVISMYKCRDYNIWLGGTISIFISFVIFIILSYIAPMIEPIVRQSCFIPK